MRKRLIIPIILLLGIVAFTTAQGPDRGQGNTDDIRENVNISNKQDAESYSSTVPITPRAQAIGSHPIIYADFIGPAANSSETVTIQARDVEIQSRSLFFKGNQITNLLSQGYIEGLTTNEYNVSEINGYKGANQICQNEFGPNTHICSQNEILASVEVFSDSQLTTLSQTGSGEGWIAGGAPGYTVAANDCRGFKATGDGIYGRSWVFSAGETDEEPGVGSMFTCRPNLQKQITCCGGN